MDPVRKHRLAGVLTVFTVLVVVCIFWLLVVPHTAQYKTYKRKSELRATLKAIRPPAGFACSEIDVRNIDIGGADRAGNVVLLATTACATDLSVEDVKAQFIQEFTRHGFAYEREAKDDRQLTLEFSAPGYHASVQVMKLGKIGNHDVVDSMVTMVSR
jgi:hypothetical protein